MSKHTMMRISNYNLETTPAGFRLNTNKIGCLRIFGIFFLIPAIFILGAIFQLINVKTPDYGTIEWVGLFILGLAFLFFGAFLCFYRSYTFIDLRKREVLFMQGVGALKKADSYPLDTITEIIISRMVVPDSDGPDDVVFPVTFLARNGHNFSIGHYSAMADAMRVAIIIAERLGLKVYDTTIDSRPEITSSDIHDNRQTVQQTPAERSKYDYKNLSFQWDGHKNSLSKLLTATQGGVHFYKVQYPKFILQRIVTTMFGVLFFMYIFGWRIDKSIPEIFGGFLNPDFFHSVEIFFTTIIGSAFVLFLFGPLPLILLSVLKPAKYAILGVGSDGLYLHDPYAPKLSRRYRRTASKHQFIRYADIKGMDIITKKISPRRSQWKIEKADNFIAMRIGTNFYEIGCGLDREQLLVIAENIKPHLMSNPSKGI